MQQGVFELLLVEDTPAEQRLAKEALKGWDTLRFSIVSDGQAALNFVFQRGAYKNAPRPNLILLDLNIPVRNGLEVLAMIKEQPELKRIPVVVLSSSSNQDDIRSCYDLHVNSYVVKPMDLDTYIARITATVTYWSKICARI